MINTSIHDSVSGDPRSYEATVFHRLHQQFPDSRGVVVRGTSNWGVRDELARAMKQLDPSVRIQALVVESHGHSALNGLVSGYHSVAKDASRDFWIDVVQENSVHEIFKDVIGRFASGAKIIFHGCEMMSAGEDQDRIQAMTAIARNFGLQSGYLYLNRNASFEFSDVVIRQPFQDEPELSGKLAHLFLQATAPLSYPGGLIAEKVWNHGYTLEVRVNGPAEEYTLYEDGLFRAETETGPGPDVLRTATLHR